MSPGHHGPSTFCDRTSFSPPICTHGALSPGVRGFWRLQQSHRKYHRLQGFLWVLAVSHLSGQEEKRGEVIHPTPENQAKTHQGTSRASGSESNLPML